MANGDYFELFGNTDTYLRYGDVEVGHHIDFISKDLIPNSFGWKYRNENTNNGTSSMPNPFLSSLLNTTINNYYGNLPANLRAHIVKKRFLHSYRYDASNPNLIDDTGYLWGEYDYLWIPTEVEVWGCVHWTSRYGGFGSRRYPIFADPDQIIKGDKASGHSRAHWWVASAQSGNATDFCFVSSFGDAHRSIAMGPDFGAPLCFRFQ